MNRFAKPMFTLLFLALGILLLSRSAAAQNFDANREVMTQVVRPSQQRAAMRFWTREQIAAARPLEMPADSGSAERAAAAPDSFAGAPAASDSGFGAANADDVARAAYPDDWAQIDAADAMQADDAAGRAPDGTSQIYTSYYGNRNSPIWKIYPHKWVGRLSFSTPGGTSYCSATSISGNNIVTAAHCVYDTTNNVWYSNWVFSPAYRNGSAPYGSFVASQCWILTAWVNLTGGFSINTWSRHDVAVCKMGNNSAGQTLNTAVGWAGRAWNRSYVQHHHNMGYPFRDFNNNLLPNAGLYLRICAAESFRQTAETLGGGCNFGGGISGGPWLLGYQPFVVAGQVNSVNSGLFLGTRNLYGARFNSNNIVPLCNAAGC